jgi:hypothetical protein
MRLCTEEELGGEICCGTGCKFDNEMVWYTKGNMFCSFIRILVQQRLNRFFKEYLTQNIIFQVKSHVTKHEF